MPGHNRAFTVAVGISVAFHLSMVTFFSIGVRFEINTPRYFRFDIVKTPQARPAAETPDSARLRAPSIEDGANVFNSNSAQHELSDSLDIGVDMPRLHEPPEVLLPTLEFDNLERLRLREQSIAASNRTLESFDNLPNDSWAQFGRELEQFRRATLGRLPFLGEESPVEEPSPQRVSVPAEGFEVYIEWMSEPFERQLLFSLPIEALWRIDPRTLQKPISFTFRAGPDGRVREVLQGALIEDEDLAASVLKALLHYRFAPLPEGQSQDQQGTLLITAARRAP